MYQLPSLYNVLCKAWTQLTAAAKDGRNVHDVGEVEEKSVLNEQRGGGWGELFRMTGDWVM